MTINFAESIMTTGVVSGLATTVVAALFPETEHPVLIGVFVVVSTVVLMLRWRASGSQPLPRSAVISFQSLAGAGIITFLFWYFIADSAVWWMYGILFLLTFGGVHARLLASEAHRRTIDGGK